LVAYSPEGFYLAFGSGTPGGVAVGVENPTFHNSHDLTRCPSSQATEADGAPVQHPLPSTDQRSRPCGALPFTARGKNRGRCSSVTTTGDVVLVDLGSVPVRCRCDTRGAVRTVTTKPSMTQHRSIQGMWQPYASEGFGRQGAGDLPHFRQKDSLCDEDSGCMRASLL
jgi:hypothetical protein